jgi:hypothetical protein
LIQHKRPYAERIWSTANGVAGFSRRGEIKQGKEVEKCVGGRWRGTGKRE